jgi:hypothetical protein
MVRPLFVLVPLALWANGLAAQSDAVYARFNALSGFEVRGFSFDSGLGLKSATQWHVPIAFVVPVGRRLSIDVSSHLASSSLESTSGAKETITGLTDTQVRWLYTLQPDRAAASLLFNLPTGLRAVSEAQFAVSNLLGSNFLSFPVPGTGTAFGVTGGLALAARAGAWNLGLAGSMRYLGSYEPYSDATATYAPGVEARLRAGMDRLLGSRTRILVGLTGSTFSSDEFGTATYKPGTRFIGDLGLVHVAGTTTFSLSAWDYYRLAGSNGDSTLAATKENVLNVELRAGLRAGPRVQIVPMVAFRQHNPAGYRGGRLYSGGATLNLGLSEQLSAQLGGRYDAGWVYAAGRGFANLTGYGATVLLRLQR